MAANKLLNREGRKNTSVTKINLAPTERAQLRSVAKTGVFWFFF